METIPRFPRFCVTVSRKSSRPPTVATPLRRYTLHKVLGIPATDTLPCFPAGLIPISAWSLRVRVVGLLTISTPVATTFRPSCEKGRQSSVQEYSSFRRGLSGSLTALFRCRWLIAIPSCEAVRAVCVVLECQKNIKFLPSFVTSLTLSRQPPKGRSVVGVQSYASLFDLAVYKVRCPRQDLNLQLATTITRCIHQVFRCRAPEVYKPLFS